MSRLITRFGADTTGFQRGVDRMRGQTQRFGREVRGTMLRAFAFGAVLMGLRSMGREMDKIGKISNRMGGASTDWLQDLNGAAERADTNLETVTMRITQLQGELNRADGPSTRIKAALEAIGMSVEDLRGMAPEQLFNVVGTAIGGLADEGEQAAAAYAILRDRTGELIPLMNSLFNEGGLAEGPRHTRENIDAVQDFNDSLSDLGIAVKTAVSPALGVFVGLLQIVMGIVKLAGNAIGTVMGGIVTSAAAFVRAMKAALTLDRSAFNQATEEFKQAWKDAFAATQKDASDAIDEIVEGGKRAGRAIGIGAQKEAGRGAPQGQPGQRERTARFSVAGTGDDTDRQTKDELRQLGQQESKLVDAIARLREAFEDPSNISVDSLQSIGGGGVARAPSEERMLKIEQSQLEELKGIRLAITQRGGELG